MNRNYTNKDFFFICLVFIIVFIVEHIFLYIIFSLLNGHFVPWEWPNGYKDAYAILFVFLLFPPLGCAFKYETRVVEQFHS